MAVSSVPSTIARYFNRARKRKHANNGGTHAPSSYWCNDDLYKTQVKMIARIPADRRTKIDRKGFFYRLGWTTAEERLAESREIV